MIMNPCRECGEPTEASDYLCLACWEGIARNLDDFARPMGEPPSRPAQLIPIVTPKKDRP